MEYAWKDAEDTKTHVRQVAASPTAHASDVAGKELPRMLSLQMYVGQE